ncbi:hypothetical protein AB0M44_21905 [Streptosporangium subroseum]|uniref:hypothetical protein n=1 Tax=Streptosporangium subroseum TaxID=106412 RepID=UPI003415BD73
MQQKMQTGERQITLGPDPDPPDDLDALGVLRRIIQQRRLADARLPDFRGSVKSLAGLLVDVVTGGASLGFLRLTRSPPRRPAIPA